MSSHTLKKLKYDGSDVQAESAVRDGEGNVIADTYVTLSGETGTLDLTSGTLKIKAITAPSSNGSSSYGVGTSSQVLKSNGTTCYWGNDANDTTTIGGGAVYKAKNAYGGYQVLITNRNNELVPMVSGTGYSTATTKTMNTSEPFDPFGIYCYTGSSNNRAAGAACSGSTYIIYSSFDVRYAFNITSNLTANAPFYIVAQLQSDGTAKLASPYYSQTLPSSDNGLIYILLGQAVSTTNISLVPNHPIYYYTNSRIYEYSGDKIPSAVTESTVSGWGFTKNAGTITGVSVNGTSVATSGTAALTNIAKTNVDNAFTTTQTVYGSDDTSANFRANHSTMSNILFANSSGTILGNFGANGYRPYWWGGQNNVGYIPVLSFENTFEKKQTFDVRPTVNYEKGLPNTYQRVQYLESSFSQYIDTLYQVASEKLKIEIMCYIPIPNNLSLFGSNSGNYDLVPWHDTSYGDCVFQHWVGTSGGILRIAYNLGWNNIVYVLDNGNISCSVNGTTTSGTYTGSIQTGRNFFVFGKNNNGSVAESGSGYRLYEFKLYDNGTLSLHLIPCYRISDGVAGLYDLVNERFLTNSGSGDFTIGKEIDGSEGSTVADVENALTNVAHIDDVQNVGLTSGIQYLTTAPSSANTDGLKIVVLSSEPATKYAGYIYLITEA